MNRSPIERHDIEVPRWAARARTGFRALLGVFTALGISTALIALGGAVFDLDVFGRGVRTWLDVVVYDVIGLGMLCGLGWLAGAVVAGYRGSDDD